MAKEKKAKAAQADKPRRAKREGGLVGRLTALVAVLFTASLLAEKVAAGS